MNREDLRKVRTYSNPMEAYYFHKWFKAKDGYLYAVLENKEGKVILYPYFSMNFIDENEEFYK